MGFAKDHGLMDNVSGARTRNDERKATRRGLRWHLRLVHPITGVEESHARVCCDEVMILRLLEDVFVVFVVAQLFHDIPELLCGTNDGQMTRKRTDDGSGQQRP